MAHCFVEFQNYETHFHTNVGNWILMIAFQHKLMRDMKLYSKFFRGKCKKFVIGLLFEGLH